MLTQILVGLKFLFDDVFFNFKNTNLVAFL